MQSGRRVAVVGLGSGGPAAALFLEEQGHRVEVFEREPAPGPVGAGILLQPTGMAVLERLGLASLVRRRGARIDRLHGQAAGGRTVMDLSYADLDPALHGLGVHRGVLFAALFDALRERPIEMRCGTPVVSLERQGAMTTLVDTRGDAHGPYDLVVLADGARSALRAQMGIPVRRAARYPWAALWAVLPDVDGSFAGTLAQVYRGTREMIGFLPTGYGPDDAGTPSVSLFWSLPTADGERWRQLGLDRLKKRMIALAPHAQPLLDQIVYPSQLTFASYWDVRMPRWHAGGVACIGDAGHAMSPQLGQGTNLALMDAWILARCIGARGEVPAALEHYSHLRRAHLRYYGAASRWLTPLFQSRLAPLGWGRDLFMRPATRVPPVRNLMLASLVGAKTGVFGRLPDDHLSAAHLSAAAGSPEPLTGDAPRGPASVSAP